MLNMNNIYLIKSLTGAWSFLPFGAVILLGLGRHLGWGGGGEILMIRNKSKPVSISFHLMII